MSATLLPLVRQGERRDAQPCLCDMNVSIQVKRACTVQEEPDHNLDNTKPMTTYIIVAGGVTTQYAQNMVRLMRRSNASPDAAWVIYESRVSEVAV